ncbi:MAG: hypothetical protein Q9227_004347 [Pyrenula ochraceoflavens]
MWNDEDNNPYGSFDQHDPTDPGLSATHFDQPISPPSSHSSGNEPDHLSRPKTPSEDGDGEPNGHQEPFARRRGGYDSRIQQILYENPDLEIIITDAGKNAEGGGFIVYTIQTGVRGD